MGVTHFIFQGQQPKNMPKICVSSPEIVSNGDISIHAKVGVVTKAKLEEISVRGNCECGEKPAVELVILVDGSDSYNNKIGDRGGSAYEDTIGAVQALLDGVNDQDRCTAAVVQFSGQKQLEGKYKPGSYGKTDAGINMYQIEVAPTKLAGNMSKVKSRLTDSIDDTLDGNGQLFLAMQDMAMPNFLEDLDKVQNAADNKRYLVVFTDEEWDLDKLKDARGNTTTREAVVSMVHKAYDGVFPCILRRDHLAKVNEDFITKKLANGQRTNYDLYTDDFESTSRAAVKKILATIGI